MNKIKVKQLESSQKEVRHELEGNLISLAVDSSDDNVNHFMKNLQAMTNKYEDLSEGQIYSFVAELPPFFNDIQEHLEMEQYLSALKMGHALFECCVHCVTVDLEGLLQPILEDIENQLYEIIGCCVEEGKAVSEVFDYIKTQTQTQDLNQLLLWMNLIADFNVVSDTYFNQLIEKVTTLINNTSSDEMKDELYLFVAQILEQTNRVSQLQQFLTKNQHIESLEVLRIEQAMLDQKYKEVIWRIEALKQRGKEALDDELGEFLEIAYFQTQQAVDYLIYLITVEGDLSRYDELKVLEPNIYPKLKKELRNSQSYVYRQLIILEQDWPALLQVVKKDPSLIVMYEDLLFLHYPKEVLQLQQTYVLQLAEKSKNKHNYQHVCQHLEKLKKMMNPDELVEFVKQLQQLYYRKRTFAEELVLFEKSIKSS